MSSDVRDRLVARAEQAKAIMARGGYDAVGGPVDLRDALAASRAATRLITPAEWPALHDEGARRCRAAARAGAIGVTAETTLAAGERLARETGRVALLNFASARRPGGGWDTGATAQEETLARASGLIATLAEAPAYYTANRACEHLFYTDHAIWSPAVPFFARDDGTLLPCPWQADVITMPAPNVGSMLRVTEADLRALPELWRQRIRSVLALAALHDVRRLVLGAWGCGAFGNDPVLVARWFGEVLAPDQPWRHGFDRIVFAIHDTSRHRGCLRAFRAALDPASEPP